MFNSKNVQNEAQTLTYSLIAISLPWNIVK